VIRAEKRGAGGKTGLKSAGPGSSGLKNIVYPEFTKASIVEK